MKLSIALAAAFVSIAAFAVTPTDKAALQSQVNALKATVDALTVDAPPVVTPPPVSAWPRVTPDVLDIDFVNVDSVLKAKLVDGSPGASFGAAGVGSAIHYGDMSGQLPIVAGVADFSQKFSNPTCPPRWGVEANGLKYLESCTNNTTETYNASTCATCRLYWWNFKYLKPAQEYYFRYMVWIGSDTLANQTELGIKLAGLGGEQLELGPKIDAAGAKVPLNGVGAVAWPLQTYRYDAETGSNYGIVELTTLNLFPNRWYTLEERVKVNTITGATYNRDGIIEVKVDGVPVWSRKDVKMYAAGVPAINSVLVQFYHGGLRPPNGKLTTRIARMAICAKTWCGPAPEVAP